MKQLSKERWRKIYGMREPTEPADPDVVGRRLLHESIIQWELKWLVNLQAMSIFISFFIIFLPTINNLMYEFISIVPIFLWLYKKFYNFHFLFFLYLTIGLFFYIFSNIKVDGKNYSEHGYPINMSHIRSTKNIISGDLYPRIKLEEKIFFIDIFGGIFFAIAFWFVVFGGISFLVKLRGS